MIWIHVKSCVLTVSMYSPFGAAFFAAGLDIFLVSCRLCYHAAVRFQFDIQVFRCSCAFVLLSVGVTVNERCVTNQRVSTCAFSMTWTTAVANFHAITLDSIVRGRLLLLLRYRQRLP